LIDPRAIVDPRARIAPGVSIGPFSVIEGDVEISEGSWIGPHVVIKGPTRIGPNNKIFQFASIGDIPQDKKYRGEPTSLEIGANNVIREYCTINRATVHGGTTRVGDDNCIMAYVHIAHDCQVGNGTVFANGASLAGHVEVGDYAILSGFTLVHQFSTLGAYCFCAAGSLINMDVPPFMMVSGHWARPYGINIEGLRRHGFPPETRRALNRAYKVLFRSGLSRAQALEQLREMAKETPEVSRLVDFLERSQRGMARDPT
jgi:UDP-N-acetylglucosamine acyltransferase